MTPKTSAPSSSMPPKPTDASSNWQKLKKTLPTSATTQKYLKKRKHAEFAKDQAMQAQEPSKRGKQALDALEDDHAGADAGKYVAIDCEFVGVGQSGTASSLARVSIVNFHGKVLYDTFVRQKERVVDYRTWVSGIRAGDLKGAPEFAEVVRKVEEIIRGRILVGHAVYNDLQVLLLSHPHAATRDTSLYTPFQTLAKTKRPALRNLAKLVLDTDIQSGEHSSIEDARTTMAIFRTQKDEWEASLKPGAHPPRPDKKKLVSHSAIDPTRRFKHARNLGLASVARANDLVPEDSAVDAAEQFTLVVNEPVSNDISLNIGQAQPVQLAADSNATEVEKPTDLSTKAPSHKTQERKSSQKTKKSPKTSKAMPTISNSATSRPKSTPKESAEDQWWLRGP